MLIFLSLSLLYDLPDFFFFFGPFANKSFNHLFIGQWTLQTEPRSEEN